MIDYNKYNRANIYIRNNFAGVLEKTSNHNYTFTYAPQWLAQNKGGIALSLPTSKTSYQADKLFPFFDNLIPEGWLLFNAQDIHKIDKSNRFAILLATGRETIGAIRVVALDENDEEIRLNIENEIDDKELTKHEVIFSPANNACPYCLRELTQKQIEKNTFHDRCIKEMWGTKRKISIFLDSKNPINSFRKTVYGASISGAQIKGAFYFDKGVMTPTYRKSNYIIKPQTELYEYIPENEHLTMAIAKSCNFKVPPFTIFEVPGLGKIFVIKRFDISENEKHLRLEDFGQILEEPSSEKYSKSYNKVGRAIVEYSDAPPPDLYEFLRRVIFSFFIGNGDMHLKNWSLLETDKLNGVFRLSPCYDFINTRLPIYDEQMDVGLAINGRKHKITQASFIQLAEDLNCSAYIYEILSEIDSWLTVTKSLLPKSYLPEDEKERYLKIVESRYNVLKGEKTDYL